MLIDATRLALALGAGKGQARPQHAPLQPERREGVLSEIIMGRTPDGEPVVWQPPERERASHAVVFAASGAGKTVRLADALVREWSAACLPARQARPVEPITTVVVDPKGDLALHTLEALACYCQDELESVVYLDPFAVGFPFNPNHLALGATPLDIRAAQLASLVAEVSTAAGAQKHLGTGSRQLDVLTHLLLGALACPEPRATVLWALDALMHPQGMKQLAGLTTSERAKAFLATTRLSDELRASCASRLRTALATTERLEQLVGAPGCVPLAQLLAPGKLVIIHLGEPPAGQTALTRFWAQWLVTLILSQLLERPSPYPGHHVRVVIDECQVVAPVLVESAEHALTTGRSRNLSCVLLSQGTTLLHEASPALVRVILTNTPHKFIGRLAAADAELLAREQAPSPGVSESIAAVRANFVARVTNLPDRHFFALTPGGRQRFESAPVDLAAWRAAATREIAALTALRQRLALAEAGTRVRLEQVIRAPAPRRRGGRSAPRGNGRPTLDNGGSGTLWG